MTTALLTAEDVMAYAKIGRVSAQALMRRLGAVRDPDDQRRYVLPAAALHAFAARGGDQRPAKVKSAPSLDVVLRARFRARSYAKPCTYVVHAPVAELVKIGLSGYFPRRIEGLTAGSPVALVVLALFSGKDLEDVLHAHFAEHRRHNEWFAAEPVISALRAAGVALYV
jgi:hypothetical protein